MSTDVFVCEQVRQRQGALALSCGGVLSIEVCGCGQVRKRQGDLLNYIVFLRVTPLLPNTFINVCAPIVRVPLPHFALGAHLRRCCAPGHLHDRRLQCPCCSSTSP